MKSCPWLAGRIAAGNSLSYHFRQSLEEAHFCFSLFSFQNRQFFMNYNKYIVILQNYSRFCFWNVPLSAILTFSETAETILFKRTKIISFMSPSTSGYDPKYWTNNWIFRYFTSTKYIWSGHFLKIRQTIKVGCIFSMVIWSEFRMWQYRESLYY